MNVNEMLLWVVIAYTQDVETVKSLVALGADPSAVDEHGRPVIERAREVGHTEIVDYLASF